MRRTLTATAALAVLLAATLVQAGEPQPIKLFNGKNLDGWTGYHRNGAKVEDVWYVKDGVLICKGRPIGYLRTKDKFTNYILELEWRFNPEKGPGNSGVLLRQIGPDKIWPKSVEAQLHHRNAGDFWNIDKFQMKVDPARTKGRRTVKMKPSNEKPLGQWNHYRIVVDGDRIELYVNGELQNVATNVAEVPGHICLQSEGAEIHFRNIVLTPIKKK